MLDGALALAPAATAATLQLADVIRPGFRSLLLVGIDYPEGRPNARTRDYTMADAVLDAVRPMLGAGPEATPGGADRFLAFLETELDPLIRSRYPTTAVLDGPLVHDTRMFLSLGELEATGGIPDYEDMSRTFGRLVDLLARRPNPRLTYRAKRYPGHTHTSVWGPALWDALLDLFGSHGPE